VFEVVGLGEVDQHIPLEVTVAPPLEVTLPPHLADVCVILVTDFVETVGVVTAVKVVNETISPYAVPTELVA